MKNALRITEGNLSLLAGKRLRLWNFSPSHNRLAYEVVPQSTGNNPEKYLIFIGCEEISTPVFCGIKNPTIGKVGTDLYRFFDSGVINITFRECVLGDGYRGE
jgi:hypothetical protein